MAATKKTVKSLLNEDLGDVIIDSVTNVSPNVQLSVHKVDVPGVAIILTRPVAEILNFAIGWYILNAVKLGTGELQTPYTVLQTGDVPLPLMAKSKTSAAMAASEKGIIATCYYNDATSRKVVAAASFKHVRST